MQKVKKAGNGVKVQQQVAGASEIKSLPWMKMILKKSWSKLSILSGCKSSTKYTHGKVAN